MQYIGLCIYYTILKSKNKGGNTNNCTHTLVCVYPKLTITGDGSMLHLERLPATGTVLLAGLWLLGEKYKLFLMKNLIT